MDFDLNRVLTKTEYSLNPVCIKSMMKQIFEGLHAMHLVLFLFSFFFFELELEIKIFFSFFKKKKRIIHRDLKSKQACPFILAFFLSFFFFFFFSFFYSTFSLQIFIQDPRVCIRSFT